MQLEIGLKSPLRAHEESFVFVNLKGSDFVYSIITKTYFQALRERIAAAPPEMYELNEYSECTSPFTFSTLTENLPFKMTPLGRFRLKADNLPERERHFLDFHLTCVAIHAKYDLEPNGLWFNYMKQNTNFAAEFRAAFDRFLAARQGWNAK